MSSKQNSEGADRLDRWGELWDELCTHPKTRAAYTTEEQIVRAGLMYLRVLADLPLERLSAAVDQCLARCEWFPTPAELRAGAELLSEVQYPPWIEGWAEVQRAIAAAPALHRWENALAKHVCEAMGGRFALKNSDMAATDRAHFRDGYEALVERARREAMIVPAAREAMAASGRPALPAPADEMRTSAWSDARTAAERVRREGGELI